MANFIWKNRHGRYYFRVRIPALYRTYFGTNSEFRSPLHTTDRCTAKRLARVHMVAFDKLLFGLGEMGRKKKQNFSLDYGVIIETTDHPSRGKTTRARLDITPEETEQMGGVDAVAKLAAALSANTQNVGPSPQLTEGALTSSSQSNFMTLQDAFDQFIDIKSANWGTPKTKTQYTGSFALLISYFGNRHLDQIKKKEAVDFFELLARLPPNINGVHSAFKGKHLRQIPIQHNGPTLKTKTLNDHLLRINAFYNWFAKTSDDPLVNPFTAVDRKREKRKPKKEPFSDDSLNKIFTSYIYSTERWPARKRGGEPSKYWVPLMLAYTGCRINEICQLYLGDITNDNDGSLQLYINAQRPDQSIKTDIWRQIPVHPVLVKAGLVEYASDLRDSGHTRLFPELNHSDNGDGYSRAIGDFNNKLYKQVGAKGTNHSFRHAVIKKMKQNDIDRELLRAVVGHDDNSKKDSTDGYGGTEIYTTKQKLKALSCLKYDFAESIINYETFRRRAPHFKI